MTSRYDWDMDRIHDATCEEGMSFNTIFQELWNQAEDFGYGLLPEDIEREADRIHDEIQIDYWESLPDDVKYTIPSPMALVGRA